MPIELREKGCEQTSIFGRAIKSMFKFLFLADFDFAIVPWRKREKKGWKLSEHKSVTIVEDGEVEKCPTVGAHANVNLMAATPLTGQRRKP